jgi:hypothetical protein
MLNTKCLTVVALLALLPALARAEIAQQSPKQFLEGIYAHYTEGQSTFEPLGKDGEQLFEHGLFVIIQRDALNSNAKNEVPLLDGDPFCDCQEYQKLKNVKIVAPETGNPHPMASVSFSNMGKTEHLQFELQPSGDSWRIYDISKPDVPSLREYLEKGLAGDQNE